MPMKTGSIGLMPSGPATVPITRPPRSSSTLLPNSTSCARSLQRVRSPPDVRSARRASTGGADSLRQRLRWFARHDAAVSVVTGSMLVVVGFLMMTNLLVRLSQFFPTIPV